MDDMGKSSKLITSVGFLFISQLVFFFLFCNKFNFSTLDLPCEMKILCSWGVKDQFLLRHCL